MKDNQEIILKIKEILLSRNEKISVAESLTAGLIQSAFGEVSGISECFEGGITSYSLKSKVNHLGVNEEHAKKVNCVSSVVAMEMATGSNKLFNTDIAIATTGYAEPCISENIIQPFAQICVHYNELCTHKKITLPNMGKNGDVRDQMRNHVANEALKLALGALSSKDIYIIHN